MSDSLRICYLTLECATNQVGIRFQKLNPDTDEYEPRRGYARVTVTLPEGVIADLMSAASSALAKASADVPDVSPAALTSELHKIREARAELDAVAAETARLAQERGEHAAAITVLEAVKRALEGEVSADKR